jgi:hypothetical protein
MDPRLSQVWIVAVSVPLAILMAVALLAEQSQRRRDSAENVLMSWEDLRLTPTLIIVGSRRDAQTIPLAGLTAVVDVVSSQGPLCDDAIVHMAIENPSHEIRRSQPYSYGASGNAQAFAIQFNLLSAHRHAAPGVRDDAYHRERGHCHRSSDLCCSDRWS